MVRTTSRNRFLVLLCCIPLPTPPAPYVSLACSYSCTFGILASLNSFPWKLSHSVNCLPCCSDGGFTSRVIVYGATFRLEVPSLWAEYVCDDLSMSMPLCHRSNWAPPTYLLSTLLPPPPTSGWTLMYSLSHPTDQTGPNTLSRRRCMAGINSKSRELNVEPPFSCVTRRVGSNPAHAHSVFEGPTNVPPVAPFWHPAPPRSSLTLVFFGARARNVQEEWSLDVRAANRGPSALRASSPHLRAGRRRICQARLRSPLPSSLRTARWRIPSWSS